MYPHTIAGLFDAVAKGTLADVEEVIKSKKVDINQHFFDTHIINFAFIKRVQLYREKINVLIKSGAIPEFHEQCNILLELYDIKNQELHDKVLNLMRNSAQFKSIYTQHHFNVLNGILPQSDEEAFKIDYFGLYPVHYALKYKKASKSWFEIFKYDLFTPIKTGLYAGTILIYFILDSIGYDDSKLFNDLISFLATLSPEQRYQILKAGPLSSHNFEYGITVARLLLIFNRFDAFTRLTQGLSLEQRFELLKSAPLNLDFAPCGITVAWELIDRQRNDDIARLTQGLSAEQRFELLKSVPSHVIHYGYTITVAALLLFHNRYDDFTRLTQELSAEQRFELLKPALSNVFRNFYGQTVAWEILYRDQFDDFTRLTQDLSVDQRFELLKSAPLHAGNKFYGLTVLDQLLDQRQFNILEMLVKDLSLRQLFELLSADYKTPPQATRKENIKLTRFNYMLNVSEALLRKILESYETDDLVSMYDNLESEYVGLDLISIIILEKINISVRDLLKSNSNEYEEIANQIKNDFKNLLNIYDQLEDHLRYSKKASELVGMTVCEACCSKYKKIFIDIFENAEASNKKYFANYQYIKARAPLNALEGYGHYLRVLGCENKEQSKLLGIAYAEENSNKNNSMLNNNLKPAESVSDATLQMPPAPSNTNESNEGIELLKRCALEIEEEIGRLNIKSSSDDDELAITEEELLSKEYKNQDTDFSLSKATEVHTMFKQQKTPHSHSPSRNKIELATTSNQRRASK